MASKNAEIEQEAIVREKEQAHEKIKSKIDILDILFHPSEDKGLINLGLINGKLKMYHFNHEILN